MKEEDSVACPTILAALVFAVFLFDLPANLRMI
jgi:hypothetical protein